MEVHFASAIRVTISACESFCRAPPALSFVSREGESTIDAAALAGLCKRFKGFENDEIFLVASGRGIVGLGWYGLSSKSSSDPVLSISYKRSRSTPAVYPRLVEFLHFDIQSTGQKSPCVNIVFRPSQSFVLIKQSESPCPHQF